MRTVVVIGRLRAWLAAGPAYLATPADARTVRVLGLDLPVRATVAVLAVAVLLLLDYHGRVDDLVRLVLGPFGSSVADGKRVQSLGRLVIEGLVPLALVVLALRDRPSRYGIALGDWRCGLAIAAVGVALMTPVVLVMAQQPGFGPFYAPQAVGTTPADVILTTALEVIPAEFFFRGFLLFALLRVIGPVAVVIATLPFAFIHLGKPELETLSTLGGGFLYGWLDWRTGSVLWSGLAHVAILSLTVLASAAASGTLG